MSLQDTPSGERVHIGLFGRRNAGKSSLLNGITGQSVAIVSEEKGTTTDPVKKAMELLPVGPVLWIDTPGLDDDSTLGGKRVEKTRQWWQTVDMALLVLDGSSRDFSREKELLAELRQAHKPYGILVNKEDQMQDEDKDFFRQAFPEEDIVFTCAKKPEAMEQLLEAAGYEIVSFEEKADVYVINTCSVTNVADKKSRQMLHRAKAKNPDAVVVAAGCYVQAAADKLREDAAVDLIIGNNRKADLVPLLEAWFAGKEIRESITDLAGSNEYEKLHINKQAEHTRAFIKVQDGCNQFCSYCIIPYTRGRVRSRRPEDVEEEVKILAEEGYKEIVLTGIHLTSYGIDFKDEGIDFLTLIKRLHEIDGIERIRFGSLEPRVITEEFASELSRLPKICPHFHLSLQSGCDDTLKRMNRHYTCEDYADRCEILRKHFRNPAITTDVIVGFPAETDADFETTRRFLEKVHFYEMHVFPYSRRAGTRADRMPDQVPEPVKKERSAVLLKLEKKMSGEYRSSFAGTEQEILLEEPVTINDEVYMTGYTKEYVKAAIRLDGRDPKALKNTFVSGILGDFLTEEILLLNEK